MQERGSVNRSTNPSLTAALTSEVRFPGEDSGRSLGAVAQRDLDAALQLLADRAQYITGSSGAAIALRRGKNDMLCRASSGANAPELGALLSTEFGLSGESVRTRQLLRCDDAERDNRVNREACRELGIASVAVMPVVNDDEVLGVFELFSGKANAFGERDFAALRRLSEMVETAVKLARAAEEIPARLMRADSLAGGTVEDPGEILEVETESVAPPMVPRAAQPDPAEMAALRAETVVEDPVAPVTERIPEAPAYTQASAIVDAAPSETGLQSNGRRLVWSIALDALQEAKSAESDESHLPAAFRNLRKCEACGFPVSAGRSLCVECEEKKWRGQLKVSPRRPEVAAAPPTVAPAAPPIPSTPRVTTSGSAAAAAPAKAPELAKDLVGPDPSAGRASQSVVASQSEKTLSASAEAVPVIRNTETPSPELILSAGLEPSQSWLAAHKFILIPILLIALAALFALVR